MRTMGRSSSRSWVLRVLTFALVAMTIATPRGVFSQTGPIMGPPGAGPSGLGHRQPSYEPEEVSPPAPASSFKTTRRSSASLPRTQQSPAYTPNVRVNNPAGDLATDSQSYSAVSPWGRFAVAVWSDSKPYGTTPGTPPYTYCGYAISCDNGATWVDGGDFPRTATNQDIEVPHITNDGRGRFYVTATASLNLDASGNPAQYAITVWTGTVDSLTCTISWSQPQFIAQVNAPNWNFFSRIAADPYDDHVYIAYNGSAPGRTDVRIVASADRGQTWGTPATVNYGTEPRPYSPDIAVGPDHSVYVVWAHMGDYYWCDMSNASGPGFVYAVRSTDHGSTWSSPSPVSNLYSTYYSQGQTNIWGWHVTLPRVAVDRSNGPYRGRIYVTWPASARWGAPTGLGTSVAEVEPNSFPAQALTVALGRDATGVLASGTDRDYWRINLNAGDVMLARLEPGDFTCGGGSTNGMAIRMFANPLDPNVAPVDTVLQTSSSSNWFAQVVFTCKVTGAYYLRLLNNNTAATNVPYTLKTRAITFDPAGSGQGRDEGDILLASSSSWSGAWNTTIVNATGPTGYNETGPSLDVDQSGRLRVVWHDHRETESTPRTVLEGHLTDLYMGTSTDGGATFGPGDRISDESSMFFRYIRVFWPDVQYHGDVKSEGDHLFTVWDDLRLSTRATSGMDVMAQFIDKEAPRVSYLTAPAESSFVNTASTTLGWTGVDRRLGYPGNTYRWELFYGSQSVDPGSSVASGALAPDTTVGLNAGSGLSADGRYDFKIYSRDAAGNEAVLPVTRHFWVDRQAPSLAFADAYSEGAFIPTASVTFTWSRSDNLHPSFTNNVVTFATELDGAKTAYVAWSGAGVPTESITYNSLAAGVHTFKVYVKDAAGNESMITRNFTVDLTAPATQITGGPAQDSTETTASPTFNFTGTDDLSASSNLQFAWRLDGGAYSAFSSATSVPLTGLTDAVHTFEVKARDQAGNEDATPASRSWTVHAQVPTVTLLTAPAPNEYTGSSVPLTWTLTTLSPVANRVATTYAYQLDGGAFSAESPDTFTTLGGLSAGSHTATVRATDDAGLTGSASRTWTVDLAAPHTVFTSAPAESSVVYGRPPSVTVTWIGSDDITPVSILSYSYRLDADPFSVYGLATSHAFTGLSVDWHTIEVKTRDAAGNEETPPAIVHFKAELGTTVSGVIASNTTWTVDQSPYVVTGDVSIQGSGPGLTAALTVQPGVEVRFAAGRKLSVGWGQYGTHYYGALNASGSADSAIVFTSGAATKAPGDWGGIVFTDDAVDALTVLDRTVVEYGGGSGGNLVLNAASPTVRNCVIRRSSGAGIWMNGEAQPEVSGNTLGPNSGAGLYAADAGYYVVGPRPRASGNTLTGNSGYAMSVGVMGASNLGLNTGASNGADAVEIRGGWFVFDAAWPATGMPYVVTGDVAVHAGNASTKSKLTVRPGVEVRFAAGTQLVIGDRDNAGNWLSGALEARGTADSTIVFTSAAAVKAPGDWKGVVFKDQTDDATTVLDYCVVEYAGQTNNANLYVDRAVPAQLAHLTLTHGSGYGAAGSSAPFAIHDSDISGNALGGIRNLTPASVIDATTNWWSSPSGPSGSGPGTGQSVSTGVLYDPWRIQPFRGDLAAPVVSITRGPAEGAILDTAVVELHWAGTDDVTPADNLAYSYRLDAAAFSSWSSDTMTSLTVAEGQHHFEVKARDLSGQVSALASRGFAYDATPPNTQITSGPADSSWINTSNATFQWTGTDAAWPADSLDFSVRLDSVAWSAYARDTSQAFNALASGLHAFSVRARDLAGHVDPTPAVRLFTVDITAPTVAIVAGPAEGETLGTAGATWTVRGADDLAASSQLTYSRSVDGGAYSAATADSVVTLTGLANGAHTLAVRSHDAAGNASTPLVRTFRVDASAPVLVVVSGPAAGAQVDTAAVAFVWRATSASTAPESLTYRSALDTLPAGAWSHDTTATYAGLAATNHTLNLEARDRWGHVGTLARTFRVDALAPNTAIASGPAPGGWTNAEPVTFTFTGTDDATAVNELRYTWRADSAAWSTPALATSAVLAGLAEGARTFEVAAIDRAGNLDATPDLRTFTVDRAAPETQIVSGVAEGGTTNTSSPAFTFTGTDNLSATVQLQYATSVDGGAYSSFSTATSATPGPLSDGPHSFAVKSRDLAGNVDATPASRSFTVHAQLPVVTFTGGPNAGGFSDADTSFTWSSTLSLLSTSVTYATKLDGGAFSAESTATTLALSGLTAGSHTLLVRATDDIGLQGTATRTWTVDLTAPTASITGGPLSGWSNGTANLLWSATDNSGAAIQYSYRMDGGAFSAYNSSTSNSYSALPEGAHLFEVKARDVVGNESAPASLAFTSDYTAPTTQIVSGPPESSTVTTTSITLVVDGTDNFTPAGQLQYQYRLDGGAYSALVASSTVVVSGLAEGTRTIEVRSRDLAGNVDGTPAALMLVAHVNAPGNFVIVGPPPFSTQTAANFAFSATSNQPANTIQYSHRMDTGPWSAYGPDTAAAYTGLGEGNHTFKVRARDAYGLEDSTQAVFAVDFTPPNTIISTGPANNGWSGSVDVTYTFTATDNLAPANLLQYEWSADGGPYSALSSSTSAAMTGLAAGPHTFAVRATDPAGHTDATPAMNSFAVDLVAPETQIAVGPVEGSIVEGSTVTFAWNGADAAALPAQLTYSIKVDAASFGSPGAATGTSLNGVADGPHTFQVRSHDPAGNVDATPATRSWITDAQGPSITVTAGPSAGQCQTATSATFNWSANDVVSPQNTLEYAYALDGSPPTAFGTTQTVTLSGLSEAVHTFTVQARDERAHVTSIARLFRVDLTAPVASAATTKLLDNSTVRVNGVANDDGGVTGYRVQVSTDPAFGSVLLDVGVGTGGQYDFTGVAGSTYYARVAATDCAGNVGVFGPISNGTTVNYLPDLVVSNVDTPPTVTAGQVMQVSFTVANPGTGATTSPQWFDDLYLSPTPTFNAGTAQFLARVQNLTYLAQGETYTSTANVNIALGTAGTYYVLAITDNGGAVPETDGGNNLTSSPPVAIALGTYADLRVTQVVVPPTSFSGDAVTVQWTTTNEGTGRTNASQWYDTVVFSDDSTFSFILPGASNIRVNDPPLANYLHTGALDPGQSYSRTETVNVPGGTSGRKFFFVVSDLRVEFTGQTLNQSGSVFEHVSELNNWTASEGMNVTLTPPPDLTVTSVTAASSGGSGKPLAVSWTVKNVGFNPTANQTWTDRVYLSTNSTLDGGDTDLGAMSRTGALPLNGTYTLSGNFVLPQGVSGPRFLIVMTDVYGQVGEYNEGNNVGVSGTTNAIPTPISVSLSPYANLVPAYGSPPDTGSAGQSAMVSWVVSNAGSATLSGSWQDDIYLSPSPTWNPAAATRVSVVGVTRSVAPTQTYSMNTTFALPTWFAGTYYLYVVADARNDVYEYTHEDDNLIQIGSVYVKPYPPVDLVASGLTVPPTAISTSGIPMSWSVMNQGQGTTLASSWNQEIWLSADNVLQPGTDLLIQNTAHGGTLASGASYNHGATPVLSNSFTGTYYVIVRVDPNLTTGDFNAANNLLVSSSPVTITSISRPNLAVLSVEAPLTGTAGQPAQARFNIVNNGAASLNASTWYWTGYLSQDGLLDGADLLLGSKQGRGTLASGAAYQDTMDFTYPEFASGGYRVLVLVDSRNDLVESNESDNVGASPGGASLSQVTLPPPSDLVVEDVVVPPTATPGLSVTVSWTLRNLGPNLASGYVQNAVYMSADTAFASDLDPLVGIQATTISLPVGGTQRMSAMIALSQPIEVNSNGTLISTLPPLSPGSYYALVRANIRNNVRESDATNNGAYSGVTLDAQVAELTLGLPATTPMGVNEARFYRVTVPAGEDLRFSTSTGVPDAINEMYVAFGRTPTLTDFDRSGPAGFLATPDVLVPGTVAGTYYVMVVNRGLGVGPTSENLSVKAELLPFSITAVTPNHGGQDGRVTSRLRGAQFRNTTTLRLEQSGIPLTTGALVRYISSAEIDVRWNLEGVPLGLYDVVAVNGTETTVAPGAFMVEPALPLTVAIDALNPDVLRRTSIGSFTVRFRNTSNVDVPVMRARLLFPATSQLRGLRVSEGLLRRSDRLPGKFAPVSGDLYVARPASGDSLAVVDLLGADLRAGEQRSVTLDLVGYTTSPYSVRAMVQPMTVTQFLYRAVAEHEVVRRAVLADPTGIDPSTVALAGDVFAFRDAALQELANGGLVAADEVLDFILRLPIGLLPGTQVQDGQGPQELLEQIASGNCTVPSLVPECTPDVGALTSALPACVSLFEAQLPVICPVGGGLTAPMTVVTTQGFVATYSADARVVTPCDPNILTGPAGYGDQRWINANEALPYRVDFENLSGVASAPAQVVSVKLPLDAGLDPTTFRLLDIGFGSHVIPVPPDRTSYTADPFFSDIGLRVHITAGVDIETHEAIWTLTSIDPVTGQQPTNPYIGFLPPNDPTGGGAGYATFTIRPFGTATSGAQVRAQASIKFDANVPLLTVEAVNRVDTHLPVSAVQPSIEVLDSTRIRLQWVSDDDTSGAGVASVALYQKRDSGPFHLYEEGMTAGQAEVPVVPGHVYSFYTLATDNTGNLEPVKTVPDASVAVGTVVLGVESPRAPFRTQFLANFPNPFSGSTTLRFELARSERVTVEFFDIQGRVIARPVVEKRFEAGPQTVRIDRLKAAPGLYFCRFQAGGYSATRRMMLLR